MQVLDDDDCGGENSHLQSDDIHIFTCHAKFTFLKFMLSDIYWFQFKREVL